MPDPFPPLRRRRLNRRTLLRTSGVAAAGAAGLALVGCGDENGDDTGQLREQLDEARTALAAAEAELAGEGGTGVSTPGVTGPGGGAVAAVIPEKFPRKVVASLSDLRLGEPVRFDYPLVGQSNFLLKLGRPAAGGIGEDGDIVAFSDFCTHMGCPIGALYKQEHAIVGPCACHFTTFDLTLRGMVVIGQATENLPQVILAIDGDDIVATGVRGIIYGYRHNLADGVLA